MSDSIADSAFDWVYVSLTTGDRWYGTTYGDSSMYEAGLWWWAPQNGSGYYYVYNETQFGYDLSVHHGVTYDDGRGYVNWYWDAATGTWDTPWLFTEGRPSALYWIGSEYDWVDNDGTWDAFGQNGQYIA